MNTRKSMTPADTATEAGAVEGNNVTQLDDVRRTRKSVQQSAAPAKAKTPAKKNRKFNQEKVDRLKAAIASGDYEVDAERIAHKFIEHDRH